LSKGPGEASEWYWMAKIGNGTRYGEDSVYFYDRRAGQQTVYLRTIMKGEKAIANETITEGSMVSDATLLGLLVKESMGAEKTSDYFEPVFSSSNKFVLVYKIEY
jgi:hypothetical protein